MLVLLIRDAEKYPLGHKIRGGSFGYIYLGERPWSSGFVPLE